MRYAVVRLTPLEGGFGPVDRAMSDDPDIRPRTLNQINVLNDGTAAFLYELSGDLDRITELLEADPNTIAYQVSETENGYLLYLHQQPVGAAVDVLGVLDEHEIVVDTPMTFVPDGGLRLTVFGSNEVIQTAAAAVPDSVRVTVERTGDYDPESESLLSLLTETQRETLEVAMELGYYEVPRQTTHEAIAEVRGRSPSAVGEQLQRIEKTIFAAIAPW